MPKKRRARTRPDSPTAVARLQKPGQVAAVIPHLLGFTPTESLVVLCLHEPRGRIGLTFRVDLPPPELEDQEGARRALADLVEDVLVQQGATRFSLAVFSEQEGLLPHAELVDAVCDRVPQLREMEVLLVRGGRWSSYHCSLPCCPPEGTPLALDEDSEPVTLVQAENVLSGKVLAPTREALEASLAGPVLLAAVAAEQRCLDALVYLEDHVLDHGRPATARMLVRTWEAALTRYAEPPAALEPEEAALLAVSLQAGDVRDRLSGCSDEERPVAVAVLAELMRLTPAPYDGLVSAEFGWLTYMEGGGAETTIALLRAQQSAPDALLTELLEMAVTRAVPPEQMRRMLRDAYRRAYGSQGLTA